MNKVKTHFILMLFKKANILLFLGVVSSIVISVQYFAQLYEEERNEELKVHEKIKENFELALEQYIHPLQGIAASLHYSNLEFSAKKFRRAAEARGMFEGFKGALGFGFIHRVPSLDLEKYLKKQRIERPNFQLKRLTGDGPTQQDEDDLFIIEFVEPTEINSKAVGLVVSDSRKRRTAAIESMVSGFPTITESIQLVQANQPEPGFLIYLPIYNSTENLQSQSERISAHIGWTYAPLLMSKIVDFVKRQSHLETPLQIASRSSEGVSEILFESKNFNLNQGIKFSETIVLFGRPWIISTTVPQHEINELYVKSTLLFVFLIAIFYAFYSYILAQEKKINFTKTLADQSQKKVEAATAELTSQKEFLQDILDQLPAMVGFWDRDFKLRLSNRQFKKFVRGRTSHFEGLHMREILGEDVFTLNKPFAEMALKGFEQEFERQLADPEGKNSTLLIKYSPHRLAEEVDGFSTIAVDISEIRNLEVANKETQALLFSNSKLSLLGEMAGGIAHEVNNPLSVINGRNSLLAKQVTGLEIDPQVKEKMLANINLISSTVDRIAKIVRGLKTFARNAENDPFENVSLKEIVDETFGLTHEKLKKQNVSVEVVGINDLSRVHCNKTQIEQVLMNLISNATDAISDLPNKWIKIYINENAMKFEIRVVDAGTGIPLKIVEKIMNPFFTTKEVGKGTGLGLSISSGIIKKHGSILTYELFDGHTSFVFELDKASADSGVKGKAS